jgi:hypothetical protein
MDNLNLAKHPILESPRDIRKLNKPLYHHPTHEVKKTAWFQG